MRGVVVLFLAVMAVLALPPVRKTVERQLYPRKYQAEVERWAEEYDLDPLLVDAFIRTESGFDPGATSSADARGLMQMTEETFLWLRGKMTDTADLTFDDLYDPSVSIRFGCYYLHLFWCGTMAISPRRRRPITAAGALWTRCFSRPNIRPTA